MVPLVPKLAEITPGATLPVPIAPIMLSPPPARCARKSLPATPP